MHWEHLVSKASKKRKKPKRSNLYILWLSIFIYLSEADSHTKIWCGHKAYSLLKLALAFEKMWPSFPRIRKLFLQILVTWRVWFPMHQTHSCVTKIILKVVLPCWLSVYKVNKLWLHLLLCSYLKESHELLQTHKIQVPMLIKSFEGAELGVCRAQRLTCWLLNSTTSYWVFFQTKDVPCLLLTDKYKGERMNWSMIFL